MSEQGWQGGQGSRDSVAGVVRGHTVYDADGKKLGTVDEVHADYLRLRKGLIFKKDLYVPAAAVSRLRGDEVYLMTREGEIDALGWDTPPGAVGRWVTIERIPHASEVAPLLERVFAREALRIPVRAERVSVGKTPAITGEVAVTKESGREVERVETTVRRLEVELAESGEVIRADTGGTTEPGGAAERAYERDEGYGSGRR